jgi:SulP family sulfate permease
VVALMMIPQGMAYALIAGLPAVCGIYAAILPALAYAALGTSTTQSVGPQAVTALMVATVLVPLAAPGSTAYVALAGQIALLSGLVLLAGAVLRAGVLVEYLSRPVMSGFTNGAVVLVGLGQLDAFLGRGAGGIHPPSAVLGVACLAVMLATARLASGPASSPRAGLVRLLSRLAPLAVLLGATAVLALPPLAGIDVARVGVVPRGLPVPGIDTDTTHWRALLVPALLIAVIVFLQSMAAAQALARLRRERLDLNRELVALGAANVAAAVSGAFPVTGGIGRSAVNHAAGARTRIAGVCAALFIAAMVLAPTGWLERLPLPALAATIIAAAVAMFDAGALLEAWRYDRGEAAAHALTLAGVLALGAERGIVLGILLSLGLLLWRASHPPIVEVGRRPGSDHFRKRQRQDVETLPHVLWLRIDQGLFFANVTALGELVEQELDARPELRHVVLLMAAVNGVDFSAASALRELNRDLASRGVALHLAEPKPAVLERLQRSALPQELEGRLHRSAARAWDMLAGSGDARTG